ncbi:hypothetical protein OG223_36685 [Streptomyces sp. NBC_01478]|uniref:WD40 repeat domain-containing protein n=1 Tax=Streptomyces sp. NBC_01478 TaxID=2903882 RepID=UPI002E33B269|nr:WD40 repeat domain-containing protein [Streptomyces sp. NBC_01478]
MAFLRDGSLALMGDAGGTCRYPSPESKQPKLDLPSTNVWRSGRTYDIGEPRALLASPNGDSLAFFGRGRGELRPHRGNGWDRHSYSLGDSVRTGAFHPKRALLAVADMYGGDVQLWQTDLRKPVRVGRLTGHHDSVLALDFSPDRERLATASADGTVRIWDVSRF